MTSQDSNKNLMSVNSMCSCLSFSGDGVINFLNNLLISDLLELPRDTFQYSALCNPKGRIISSMWVNIIHHENILMICPKNMLDSLLKFFNMRKFRLIINISEINKTIVLKSNQSIEIVDIGNTLPEIKEEDFYNYFFKSNIPWIDANNTEQYIPQHVNLDLHEKIMSFTKGCYPGQEIIARIKYLGKIKKRMCLLEVTDKNLSKEDAQNCVSPAIRLNSSNIFTMQAIKNVQ